MSDFTRRIVVLGKTGAGKSSLANTIFQETAFQIDHTPESGTSKCQAKFKCINGQSIKWVDTPGFFDTGRSEEEMKSEILRCIIECAPGPHVFLVVLKVEKFTEHEKDVVKKLLQYFSEEALKYAVIVLTHGDQLPEKMKIEEFVSKGKDLSDLVKKCGNRCHVFDNKYWKNQQGNDEYRSNQFQREEVLKTIDKIIEENKGGCYTNKMLQGAKKQIQQEEDNIKLSPGNMTETEIKQQAKDSAFKKLLNEVGNTTMGLLLGAFLGVAVLDGMTFIRKV